MEMFLIFAAAILAIAVVGKILSFPIRIIVKLLMNGIMGGIILLILNFFGGMIGLQVNINIVSALIAGFFGIPGVILIVLMNLL